MTRRTTLIFTICLIAFAISGFGIITAYCHHVDEELGVKATLEWAHYDLPTCSEHVTKLCIISMNIVAFRHDGSVLVVASNLPPAQTKVVVRMPQESYTFWLMVSGHDANGAFTVSLPGSKEISITGEDKPLEGPLEVQPQADDSSMIKI